MDSKVTSLLSSVFRSKASCPPGTQASAGWQGQGAAWRPHNPRRSGQQTTTSLRQTQSVGLAGIHPRVPRELAFIAHQQLWLTREVPVTGDHQMRGPSTRRVKRIDHLECHHMACARQQGGSGPSSRSSWMMLPASICEIFWQSVCYHPPDPEGRGRGRFGCIILKAVSSTMDLKISALLK